MPYPINPENTPESTESFEELLSQFEKSHAKKATDDGRKQLEGIVVSISSESVYLDIGYKTEGVLPLSVFSDKSESVKPGDKVPVSVKGRNSEGYYELTRFKVEQPKDWASLEKAFANKSTITGTVTGVVKGGVSVDVGVRAFMPASRSATHDAAELEKLVEQEIRCRIIKLDIAEEDVVVDRRVVIEEEERAAKEQRYSELKEGDTIIGTVRSLADYGAFVDIGGVDGLLHVSDLSWGRGSKPEDVLSVGQQVEARILKIEPEKRRISLGLKQLQAQPWDAVAEKYHTGEKIKGTVSRLMDFGAFVELEPGVEGLIHISEMSWGKKVRTPADVVKPGETVEAVILSVNVPEKRISLGLKQALGDPWTAITQKFAAGSVVEGPVTSLTNFGAFVQVAEGIEGMVHISDISAEKRINHPQDVLKVGQVVKAQILELDIDKRRLKLGMKQLVPTGLDEYIAEHKTGDIVTGRMVNDFGKDARVELGEGIQAICRESLISASQLKEEDRSNVKADISALSSMLKAKWKSGSSADTAKAAPPQAGQVRSFRIVKLDPSSKTIEVELA